MNANAAMSFLPFFVCVYFFEFIFLFKEDVLFTKTFPFDQLTLIRHLMKLLLTRYVTPVLIITTSL